MRIWLITIGEILPVEEGEKKQRTAMLAEKLVQKGHDVIWWTSAFNHFKKDWLVEKDTELITTTRLKLILLKGCGYKKNISFSRFIDHRIVARKFYKKANNMKKPDIIIASMPPHDLAYKTVMFAKKNNLPVLVDVRDPWPDIFLEHLPSVFRRAAKIFLFNDFRMVKKTMQYASGLIAVTHNFMNWALAYANRQKSANDNVLPLGYKKLQEMDLSKVNAKFFELEKNLKNKFIVFFVGTFSKSYHNPLILVKTAEMMKQYTDIHFVIAGEGELLRELKTSSEKNSNITLTGWLNQNEIEFWLKHSKVGVCPATKFVNLPTNKIFAYLSAGLPVISAFDGDLKEIIEKYKTGFYYPPNDVDELVNCILKLYKDKSLYQKMYENAKDIFNESFDAEIVYDNYVKHIELIVVNEKKAYNKTANLKFTSLLYLLAFFYPFLHLCLC